MIVRVDTHLEGMAEIQAVLKESGIKRPDSVIRKAINKTARNARKRILQGVKSDYTIKGASAKDVRLKTATASRLWAEIDSAGRPLSLVTHYKYWRNTRKNAARAAVKRGAPLKRLEAVGIKGFVAVMRNGHRGIFQRVPGQYMKNHKPRRYKRNPNRLTKGKEALREFYGPSVPKLAEMEYRTLEEETGRELESALWNFIDEAFHK